MDQETKRVSSNTNGSMETEESEAQRKDFFETIFSRGAEFASELIKEVNSLKRDVDRLQDDNLELRHQLASDDAIRDLLKKIDDLEGEKNRLKGAAKNAAIETSSYVGRFAEMEKELDSMANLYVALYQLHATLSPQEVLGVIEQLLAQFVGAGSFVIYLRRQVDNNAVFEPVHAYHCEQVSGDSVVWNQGPIGETAATQVNYVSDSSEQQEGGPIACIPMVVSDQTIGVIVILELFEQKSSFVDIDFEFFKLLAIHSASAIVGSGLMASSGGIDTGLEIYERL